MEVVTVVNRTSKIVKGTWDGRPRDIQPHGRIALPLLAAEAFKRQNVVMGSEDPSDGSMLYLVGIEEHGDDISPIEQTNAITRMNRKALGFDEEVVKGKTGLYSGRDVQTNLNVGGAGGVTSGFVKP